MPSKSMLSKTKLTITISNDIAGKIDEISRKKGTPRSQVMEEMLRDWLQKSKKTSIEKEIEAYYLSLSEKEKEEDREWDKIAADSSKRSWDD